MTHVYNFGFVSRLCLITLFVLGGFSIAAAQTTTLKWEDLNLSDEAKIPSNSVLSADGVDMTLNWWTLTDGGTFYGKYGNDFISYESGNYGGDYGVLSSGFFNSNNDPDDKVVTKLTFSEPVTNLHFSIIDVDSGSWDDGVEIFYNGGNNAQSFATSIGSTVCYDNETYMTGFEGNGSGAAASSTNGNVNLNFGSTPIYEIKIKHFATDDCQSNPSMFVAVSDIKFDTPVADPPSSGDCSENLLTNAGFETGNLHGWEVWSACGPYAQTAYKAEGHYAARIDNRGGIAQKFYDLVPGQSYTLTAKGKTHGSFWASFGLKIWNSDWSQVVAEEHAQIANNVGFQEYTLTITVPEDGATLEAYTWRSESYGDALFVDCWNLCVDGDGTAPVLSNIGDRVWNDLDGDGIQDSGEQGIDNVTVNLLDDSGSVVATDVTSGGGNYLFEDLPNGDYTVSIVTSTLPADFVQTYDLDDGTDGFDTLDSSVVTLNGEDRLDVDFGYQQASHVSCEITDGCLTIELTDLVDNSDGSSTYSWTLTANGCSNAVSYVAFQLPHGYVATSPSSGTYHGQHTSYTVENTTNNPFYSIKFESNGEGIKNGGEFDVFTYTIPAGAPQLSQLMVKAKFGTNSTVFDFNTDNCIDDCTVEIEGYQLNDLTGGGNDVQLVDGGTYNLSELPQDFRLQANTTATVDGGSFFFDVNGQTQTENVIEYEFPNSGSSWSPTPGVYVIQGTYYTEPSKGGEVCAEETITITIVSTILTAQLSGNVSLESGEDLEGITINLISDLNQNGQPDAGEPIVASTETDVNGNYEFTNLAPGQYVVDEVQPVEFETVSEGDDDQSTKIEPTGGQDFAVAANGCITKSYNLSSDLGILWFDFDSIDEGVGIEIDGNTLFDPISFSDGSNFDFGNFTSPWNPNPDAGYRFRVLVNYDLGTVEFYATQTPTSDPVLVFPTFPVATAASVTPASNAFDVTVCNLNVDGPGGVNGSTSAFVYPSGTVSNDISIVDDVPMDDVIPVTLVSGQNDLENNFIEKPGQLDPGVINIDLSISPFLVTNENQVVTFSYPVTNPGTVPLSNVVVTTNLPCANSDPVRIAGDDNGDEILDVNEVWIYETSCTLAWDESSNGAQTADVSVQGVDPLGNTVTDTAEAGYFLSGVNMEVQVSDDTVYPGQWITVRLVTRLLVDDNDEMSQFYNITWGCNVYANGVSQTGGPNHPTWADPSADQSNGMSGTSSFALDANDAADFGVFPDWVHEFDYQIPTNATNGAFVISAFDFGSVRAYNDDANSWATAHNQSGTDTYTLTVYGGSDGSNQRSTMPTINDILPSGADVSDREYETGEKVIKGLASAEEVTESAAPSRTATPTQIESIELTPFPNPTMDVVNVILDESFVGGTYQILDMNGFVIEAGDVRSTKMSFNISENKSGVYGLNITNGTKVASATIVKQ